MNEDDKYININKVAEIKGLKSNRSLRIAINQGKYIAREVSVKGGKSYEILLSSLEIEIQEELTRCTTIVPFEETFVAEDARLTALARVDLVKAILNFRNKYPTQKQADDYFLTLYNSGEYLKHLHRKELGMGMSDDAVDAAVKFGDTMGDIKNSMSYFGAQIGAETLPVLQKLADELIVHLPEIKAVLTPIIKTLGDTVVFLTEHMQGLVVIGSALVGTFIAFNAINGVITTIKTLQAVIKAVSAAQGIWNALMLANPVGLIAVGVGVLVAGVVALVQNWDKITAAVRRAIDAMKSFVGLAPKNVSVSGGGIVEHKNALGTAFSSGGATLVGEYGPELVNMRRGASVTPVNSMQKILSGNGGVNIHISIAGNMIGNNEFLEQLSGVFAMKLRQAMVC